MPGTFPYAEHPYGYAPSGEANPLRAMPGARKRSAIVAESTQGTTPASPGFLILRDISISSDVERTDTVSRERRSDRAAAAMASGLESFQKQIELPFARDAATDLLWEAALCSTFSADVIKNGSTRRPFTLEETYDAAEGAARRIEGCVVDEFALALSSNEFGRIRVKLRGLSETTGPNLLPGATYADPTPAHDPVTGADIAVSNLFGINNPRVVGMSLMLSNNTTDRHAFGATAPVGTGLGAFRVIGVVNLYFTRLEEYSFFMQRRRGLGFDITIGSVSGAKDRLQVFNADVWDPGVDDPGSDGDHKVSLHFAAKHSDADGGVIALTRNVA